MKTIPVSEDTTQDHLMATPGDSDGQSGFDPVLSKKTRSGAEHVSNAGTENLENPASGMAAPKRFRNTNGDDGIWSSLCRFFSK